MFPGIDISPVILSIKVSLISTFISLIVGTLCAWRMALSKFRGKLFVETLLTLPLVLPPSVAGYYLLLLMGRGTAWGRWLNDTLNIHLLFTWEAAVIASTAMGFPLMVKAVEAAMKSVEIEIIESARTLGANEWRIFWHILLPCSYRGIIAGTVLAFARGIGEFGATLMVAGNIPGLTQTLPLALYASVQTGNESAARLYTLILTLIAFGVLWAVNLYQTRWIEQPPQKHRNS